MLLVETAYVEKVVGNQHGKACPLELSWSVHPKDHHEATKLHQQGGLQDRVVSQETNAPVAVVIHGLPNLLGSGVDPESFLKTVLHQGQSGHVKVLIRAEVCVDVICLHLHLLVVNWSVDKLLARVFVPLNLQHLSFVLIKQLFFILQILLSDQLKKIKQIETYNFLTSQRFSWLRSWCRLRYFFRLHWGRLWLVGDNDNVKLGQSDQFIIKNRLECVSVYQFTTLEHNLDLVLDIMLSSYTCLYFLDSN